MPRFAHVDEGFGAEPRLDFLLGEVLDGEAKTSVLGKISSDREVEGEEVVEETSISGIVEAFRLVAGVETEFPRSWRPDERGGGATLRDLGKEVAGETRVFRATPYLRVHEQTVQAKGKFFREKPFGRQLEALCS